MAGNDRRKCGLPMRRDANASSVDVWERAFCHLRLIVNWGAFSLPGQGSDEYGSPPAARYFEHTAA